MSIQSKLKQLKQIYAEITKLDQISCLVSWDQETYMPPKAAAGRSEQLAILAKIIHQKNTSPQLGQLLQVIYENLDQLSTSDQRFIRQKYRQWQLNTRFSSDFVSLWSSTTSQAIEAWKIAKAKKDFSLFAPFLHKIVDLLKQKTQILGQPNNYDALLDYYEPNLTKSIIDPIFEDIKTATKQILANVPDTHCEKFITPIKWQKSFTQKLLSIIGYDFEAGRQDQVAHPFMTRVGDNDIRVTNTFHTNNLSSLFSALHEGGHALYEQGMDLEYIQLLTDDERSLVIHESQSRFWENIIGRSEAFWRPLFVDMQTDLPEVFGKMSLEEFLSKINIIKPSLIRVQADEVTYNLHIIIRYEIEKMLIEQGLKVNEVPQVWNQKYQEYLGVMPAHDGEGCLQDVHWSIGNFGYFPTYTLGNVLSAQIWNYYKKQNPNYQDILNQQDYPAILFWLQKNVHKPGTLTGALELVKSLTGEDLNAGHLIDYLENKYKT